MTNKIYKIEYHKLTKPLTKKLAYQLWNTPLGKKWDYATALKFKNNRWVLMKKPEKK